MEFKNHLNFNQLSDDNTLSRNGVKIALRFVHLGEVNRSGRPIENSVVMSHFNRVQLAIDGVRSVLKQEMDGEFEVVVVDDCSKEDITPLIEEFKNDSRFSLVSLSANHGNESLPQNIGIHLSSGRRVSFLDSDDEYIGSDALVLMNESFNAHPEVVMACSDIVAQVRVDVRGTILGWIPEKLSIIEKPAPDLDDGFEYRMRRHHEYSQYELIEHPYYSGIRMMTREALYTAGGWPEDLHSVDDLGMVLHMNAIGRTMPVNHPLYLWKIHEANDSLTEYTLEVKKAIRDLIIRNIKIRGLSFADLKANCSSEFWDLYKITPQDLNE